MGFEHAKAPKGKARFLSSNYQFFRGKMLVFQGMFSSFYMKHSKDRRKIDGSKFLSRPKNTDSSDESMDFSGSCKGW